MNAVYGLNPTAFEPVQESMQAQGSVLRQPLSLILHKISTFVHSDRLFKLNKPTYAIANLGQLKNVFKFDVGLDSDSNGLPDWWETHYFGHLGNVGSSPSAAGDGYTLAQEYTMGRNPNDYYQGIAPVITIVGGGNQYGIPSTMLTTPLSFYVSAGSNSPVTIAVTPGTALLATSPTGATSASLSLRTSPGNQLIYLKTGTTVSDFSTITITPTGYPAAAVTTTVGCYDSTIPAPTGLTVAANGQTTGTLTWTNNSTNGTVILESINNGTTWQTIATVGSGVSSYTLTVPFGQAAEFEVYANSASGGSGGGGSTSGGGSAPSTSALFIPTGQPVEVGEIQYASLPKYGLAGFVTNTNRYLSEVDYTSVTSQQFGSGTTTVTTTWNALTGNQTITRVTTGTPQAPYPGSTIIASDTSKSTHGIFYDIHGAVIGTSDENVTLSQPNTTAMLIANLLTLVPPFINNFTEQTYEAGYLLASDETSAAVSPLQYKFKIDSKPTPTTVVWDDIFYPSDGSALVHNIQSWTGSNATGTPVTTITKNTLAAGPSGTHYVRQIGATVTWETAGDNTPIDGNVDPATNMNMPGGGNRIFPDKKSPTDTGTRNKVTLRVSVGPQFAGVKVYVKAFDVDDPTPNTPGSLDANHLIDPNDTATVNKGNDNLPDPEDIPQTGFFTDSNTDTDNAVLDSTGEATFEFNVGYEPGDNYRVAVSFLPSSIDFTSLQVTDSTAPYYVPPSEDQPVGFGGSMSPPLTVWRHLNVEIDSMPAVPTSGAQKNFEASSVSLVSPLTSTIPGNPYATQTIVTLNDALQDTLDRYENGYLTVGGVSYEILNSRYYNYTITDHQVVVTGTVPGSAAGQSCTVVDDDDKYLSQLGLSPVLPQNQNSAAIVYGIMPAYAQAYIQIVDANAMGWNPRQTIDFYLNLDVAEFGSNFGLMSDLTDTQEFWACKIAFGYQPAIYHDHDPNTEDFQMGMGRKYPGTYIFYGFAAVYLESIREEALGSLDAFTDTQVASLLSNSKNKQSFIKSYNDYLWGTVAHEIGHSPGGQTDSEDTDELGLMSLEVPIIETGFTPVTIKRFRHATQWTH